MAHHQYRYRSIHPRPSKSLECKDQVTTCTQSPTTPDGKITIQPAKYSKTCEWHTLPTAPFTETLIEDVETIKSLPRWTRLQLTVGSSLQDTVGRTKLLSSGTFATEWKEVVLGHGTYMFRPIDDVHGTNASKATSCGSQPLKYYITVQTQMSRTRFDFYHFAALGKMMLWSCRESPIHVRIIDGSKQTDSDRGLRMFNVFYRVLERARSLRFELALVNYTAPWKDSSVTKDNTPYQFTIPLKDGRYSLFEQQIRSKSLVLLGANETRPAVAIDHENLRKIELLNRGLYEAFNDQLDTLTLRSQEIRLSPAKMRGGIEEGTPKLHRETTDNGTHYEIGTIGGGVGRVTLLVTYPASEGCFPDNSQRGHTRVGAKRKIEEMEPNSWPLPYQIGRDPTKKPRVPQKDPFTSLAPAGSYGDASRGLSFRYPSIADSAREDIVVPDTPTHIPKSSARHHLSSAAASPLRLRTIVDQPQAENPETQLYWNSLRDLSTDFDPFDLSFDSTNLPLGPPVTGQPQTGLSGIQASWNPSLDTPSIDLERFDPSFDFTNRPLVSLVDGTLSHTNVQHARYQKPLDNIFSRKPNHPLFQTLPTFIDYSAPPPSYTLTGDEAGRQLDFDSSYCGEYEPDLLGFRQCFHNLEDLNCLVPLEAFPKLWGLWGSMATCVGRDATLLLDYIHRRV